MLGRLGAPQNEADSFSLNVFASHNHTEHDASLSRVDVIQGGVDGTICVDRRLVDAMIRDVRDTKQPGVNTRSLGHTRVRREQESMRAGSPPLSELFTGAAQGEAALLAVLFGTGDGDARVAPMEQVRAWMVEERFPVELGYRRSAEVLTGKLLGELSAGIKKFQDLELDQTVADADAATTAGGRKGAGDAHGHHAPGLGGIVH